MREEVAELLALEWTDVEHDGVVWRVAPRYVHAVGIGQAKELAAEAGCELPSPRLVDTIWRAADLRIAPIIRSPDNGLLEDWGPSMSSRETIADQARRIEEAIGGRPYRLVGGTHKDVVQRDGVLGLYGWHRLDGRVIQPFYSHHAPTHRDYSQGLRLVRKGG